MAWIRRYFLDLIGAHVDGVRAVFGLPFLFAALILWEFAQHAMEVRIGFYRNIDVARAMNDDPSRMVLGWIKMISVYVGGFFVIRYLTRDRPGAAPLAVAIRRYLPYIAYSLVLFALVFYAPRFVPPQSVDSVRAAVGLGQVAVEPLLIVWIVSAATDGAVRGPVGSVRRTGWLYFWALALFFVGRLPVNAAHQLLARYAIGQPAAVLWPMLALDAVIVGLVIAVIPALYVRIARLIDERRAPATAPAIA